VVAAVGTRPALLASELVRAGAQVVVVGGTARWLTSGAGWPRDLDVVAAPEAVPGLVAALTLLGAATTAGSLLRAGTSCLTTAWGQLDVFVADRPPAIPVVFDGVVLAVRGAV
jgi:hypothetical protein